MRRLLAMLTVLGGLAAGLGCHHIGGKCDCGAHPGDVPGATGGPHNPYPFYPATPAPAAAPAHPGDLPPSVAK